MHFKPYINTTNLFILFFSSNSLVNCFVKFMDRLLCSFVVVTFASFLNLKTRKYDSQQSRVVTT